MMLKCESIPNEPKRENGAIFEKKSSSSLQSDFSTSGHESFEDEDDEIMNDEDFITLLLSNRSTTLFGGNAEGAKWEKEHGEEDYPGNKTTQKGTESAGVPATHPTTCFSLKIDSTTQRCSEEGCTGHAAACDRAPPGTNEQAQVVAEIERLKSIALASSMTGYRFLFHPDLPSIGTALHFYNACVPCDYVAKGEVCMRGEYCGRCHYCPVLCPKASQEEGRSQPRRESAIRFEAWLLQKQLDTLEERRMKERQLGNDLIGIGKQNDCAWTCDPCAFFHKGECTYGDACDFCHQCSIEVCRTKKSIRRSAGRRIKKVNAVTR